MTEKEKRASQKIYDASVPEIGREDVYKRQLCALSGGVDSSVAAAMLAKAVGKQLTCVFVDHGLLRKNEMEQVCEVFGPNGQFELNFVCVNARERFYERCV